MLLQKLRYRPWFIKASHWEYWSFNTVYIPILWYYAWLALRARTFYFFNAANPGIEYGGFLSESKWCIHQLLPELFTPKTKLVRKAEPARDVISKASLFDFPFICKPDTGSRGRGVAVIADFEELLAYHDQCPQNYLIQQKINYPMEAGFFYVRMPGEKKGFITGIVEKKYLSVTGDGCRTVEQLVLAEPRYILQYKALKSMLGNRLQEVPARGEKSVLVPFGNHARGCLFLDATDRLTEGLNDTINHLCQSIDGFYFGRLDIKFQSWDLLEQGKQFMIIELNGSGSEPTHMYDPKNNLLQGWREIIRHWKLLYKVAKINHQNGCAYLSYKEAKQMFSLNKLIDRQLQNFVFRSPSTAKESVNMVS